MRENAPQLGDLSADFDFTQPPRPPEILPVRPPTDLILPSARAAATGRSLALPRRGPLRAFELRVIANRLGMTPANLRGQLGSGQTLRSIARARGVAVAQLRQAVLRALLAEVNRPVR